MKNNPERCKCCGHIISEREISLYSGLVTALWNVYLLAESKKIVEFKRKEIKHLFKNENDTARFGDWVMFGGLVYKPKKGVYGIDMAKCKRFFDGLYNIPTKIWKNPVTKELKKENYKTLKEIPNLLKLLNEDMEYVVRYRNV